MHPLMFVLVSVLTPATIVAQPAALSGDWQVTQRFFGATRYATLHIDQTGDNVKGTFAGATFECQLRPGVCAGSLRNGTNPPNGTIRLTVLGNESRRRGRTRMGRSISSPAVRRPCPRHPARTSSRRRRSTTTSRRDSNRCFTSLRATASTPGAWTPDRKTQRSNQRKGSQPILACPNVFNPHRPQVELSGADRCVTQKAT
jgi:hypothetical protein